MLFDLKSGKRRRVVQVVFGFLAFLFFISFVGFGIGSDVTGGIFDAIGLGGSGSGSDPQYEQEIEDAEATLETQPDNQKALLDLARFHYLAATASGIETDPDTGQTSISEEANSHLEQSAQAWTDYLETKPPNPDVNVAANAAQTFVLLGDAAGAAEAQEIVASEQKTAAAYGQLAYYYYADGQFKKGDAAAKQAVDASEPSAQEQIEKNLASIRKQAVKQQELIKEQAEQEGQEAGEAQLEDPFGGLGGGSTAPVAPAP